ncbi:MAG: peptidylprolyl isomerase [Proteobacteria bacterium]|nr:peptidylprolyl isomerase [Pseudomonadota bacterium]MCH9758102.1 peptidylprolyl isomerase [Pseudomonadota bacterium]
MKKSVLLFSVALLATGCQQEPDVSAKATTQSSVFVSDAVAADAPNDIIAVVNGVDIPASRMTFYAQGNEINDNNRSVVIDNLITSELITQAAKKSGIADTDAVRAELIIAEQTILGRAYVSQFFEKHPINEERVAELYKEMSAEFAGAQEYDAAHILVEDEATANSLLEQIKADPSQFAALAQQHSQDPGSGTNGGKLGWVAAQALVPEFGQAMTALKDGEMTQTPVKTTFGFHIIRVDGRRDLEIPAINEELRERLLQGERAELFSQHITELRDAAEVELR